MSVYSLDGKRGLIIGVANEHSIAWGCAKAMRDAGAELAITYLNEKAERFVRPLAESLHAPIILPLDVTHDGEMEAVFTRIRQEWGQLDFVVHAIAFAEAADLNGRVTDCSREGFAKAMDISCHSLMRVTKHAEPLMHNGGSILTLSYLGAERHVQGYGVMGPVKAALEASVRYMAAELGGKNIRVNALSAGLIPTRAGKGIQSFDTMYARFAENKALSGDLTIEAIGCYAAFLASDAAQATTGTVHYADNGYHMQE